MVHDTSKKEISLQRDQNERKKVLKYIKMKDRPDILIAEFNKLMQSKKTPETEEVLNELLAKSCMAMGLDTHMPLILATDKDYRPLAIEFANKLTEEFNVKVTSEKAIIHILATAYVKCMALSSQLSLILETEKTSQNINTYYANLSKDLDRAHRQFTSAFILLKELKSPTIKVNIKTNNAFIAQNQQLNNLPYENDTP